VTKGGFDKEADLCTAFIETLPKGWTAYPETGGFDLVLRRDVDGFQIGVEAKLRLNAKVILQAAETTSHWDVASPGPDCRAVLIPEGVSLDLSGLLPRLGLTCIRMRADRGKHKEGWTTNPFQPQLPDTKWDDGQWFECCPAERIVLPDWVPDTGAGNPAPVSLTPWKVKAIKIAVTLNKRGYVTRRDFQHFQISMSRWMQDGWLLKTASGGWIAGRTFPDLRARHPTNYGQIEADYDRWKNPVLPPTQPSLLEA